MYTKFDFGVSKILKGQMTPSHPRRYIEITALLVFVDIEKGGAQWTPLSN